MKKGDKLTHEQLKELGYKHYVNYGNWEVWAKHSTLLRVYVDIETRIIVHMYSCGHEMKEMEEL